MPVRLMTSWRADPAASWKRPKTRASARFPAAGIVVTEMNTPTRAADLADVSDSMPAAPATRAVMSENQPGW
jgi:hypothetical protein